MRARDQDAFPVRYWIPDSLEETWDSMNEGDDESAAKAGGGEP
jgi:hypothetical protein